MRVWILATIALLVVSGVEPMRGTAATGLAAWLLPAALAWTAAVVVYLLWSWLTRHDEDRLEAALRTAYPGIDPDA